MRFDTVIEIAAPITACYKICLDFENLAEVCRFVKSIRQKGDPNVWRWTVQGKNGQLYQWDLELDAAHHRNDVLSWHTVRNADISHSGALTLHALPSGHTQAHFVVEISNHTLPGLSQDSVGSVLNECLEDLQRAIEQPGVPGFSGRGWWR